MPQISRFGADIDPAGFLSPQAGQLWAAWSKARGDRAAPTRAEMSLEDLLATLPHTYIIAIHRGRDPETRERATRYQLLGFGTELARQYGENLEGRFVDEVHLGDALQDSLKLVDEAERLVAPAWAVVRYIPADGEMRCFERLLCPLVKDPTAEPLLVTHFLSVSMLVATESIEVVAERDRSGG